MFSWISNRWKTRGGGGYFKCYPLIFVSLWKNCHKSAIPPPGADFTNPRIPCGFHFWIWLLVKYVLREISKPREWHLQLIKNFPYWKKNNVKGHIQQSLNMTTILELCIEATKLFRCLWACQQKFCSKNEIVFPSKTKDITFFKYEIP